MNGKTNTTDYDLAALFAAANAACAQALVDINEISGPINWSDLSCCEARRFVTNYGNTGYSVTIKEAGSSEDLRTYINRYLEDHGFADIEILLEW